MSRPSSLLAAVAAFLIVGALAPAAMADGNVNFIIGQKEMDENFGQREDIEEQDMFGALIDFGVMDWPVNISFDIISSSQDVDDDEFDLNLEGSTLELDLGAKLYFMKDTPFRPYVGGGLAFISAEIDEARDPDGDLDFDEAHLEDESLGYFVNGGLLWRIGERFNLGADVRWSKAEIEVEDDFGDPRDVEAGGFSYGVFAGFGW